MTELLCPAGNPECLEAAVKSGADAVYFGGSILNARMSAANFDNDMISYYSDYCKVRNVKTYLTLNTVVSDYEIDDIKKYIEFINSTNISAVIVQSPGLAKVIKSLAPSLPIHASTQMTIHSLNGALEAKNLGFERIVLSRELSKSNIKHIVENCGMETECFIHGALCMCYSGQCYFSSMIGTRSGNRGRCAQPCRQKYKNGYELSLKDLCMAENFTEFLKLGVTSFKIEGRLKSKEYITGVTSVYRKLIDENRNATPDEVKFLQDIFSRQGFTNDYFMGKPSKKMFGYRTEENKLSSRNTDVECTDKKIPCELEYIFKKDVPFSISLKVNGKDFYVQGEVPQTALKSAQTKEDFEKRLLKTGNTPFEVSKISGEFNEGLFSPVSEINGLRRTIFEDAENVLKEKQNRVFENKMPELSEEISRKKPCFNYHFLREVPDLKGLEQKAKHIWAPLFGFKEKKYDNVGVSLPRIITDSEKDQVKNMLLKAKEKGVTKALCHTIGQISLVKEVNLEPYVSFSFNVYNSYDIEFLKELGAKEVTVSPELSQRAIKFLKKTVPVNLVVYGKLPVMVTENCIIKNADKCVNYEGFYKLSDKTGADFKVLCDYPHRNIILNSVPINLSDKKYETELMEVSGLDMIFSDEKNVCEIIKSYINEDAPKGKFTRGLYFRKVQ